MQDHECNSYMQNKTILPSITRTTLEEILELLINSCDVNILTKTFSTLGVYLLSSETYYDRIIKYDPLYDKVTLILNCGSQAKITIALNFICALLYLNEDGQTRKKSLHIHAQNMIRISGCLTAMTNLFISFMLYQDTLKALCRSISEACRDSTTNQTCCSHLVPLCIRRCRAGSSDMFIVLQSLLSCNRNNVKLFYDNDGLTIFTRESLQHPFCLQLLNTVVENTTNENKDVLLKSSYLFDHLRSLQHIYGGSNPIGDWISIILFSYRKVFSKYSVVKNICLNEVEEIETNRYSKNVYSKKRLNETNELFRKILNELIGQQNADYKYYTNTKQNQNNNNNINIGKDHHDTIRVEKKNLKHILSKPVFTASHNDLSFSFLLKDRPLQNNFKDQRQQINRYDRKLTTQIDDINKNPLVFSHCNEPTRNISQHLEKANIATLTQEEDEDTEFSFAPPFVSTPKKCKDTFRSTSVSQSSLRSFIKLSRFKRKHEKQTRINTDKIMKRKLSECKQVQNKTIGSKFFDIINGSCTTLVKSFTCLKNIFRSKVPSTSRDEEIDISCTDKINLKSTNNSFTNYMRNRDALSYHRNNNRDETLLNTGFSIDDDKFHLQECNTCNDTITLQQKLKKDSNLQRTLKRLKLGINLYGCDFKKISKNMWPNEHYMTPSVLYNLYRKLIIK
ncbi:unnamed protein product [Euphydryas editha]|uniref:Uncharacterized protein n=1 Tax=Euphydryas editha TaxID=104508 RepID=A0AAU9UKC1_EUPED|nr:unnamed protein product [Euphydryas editha]